MNRASSHTAGKCGYHVAPLQEVLAAGRLKYLDLLGSALSAAVAEAIHLDAQALAPVEIDSPAAAAELGADLGLPLTADGGGPPTVFPSAAPFSPTVPVVVRALRRRVPFKQLT